ncbi:MAG: hypothetical protein ACYTGN_05060 [Planctomycetota bacterium]|jgi:mono/diheme cytochrome c family protein
MRLTPLALVVALATAALLHAPASEGGESDDAAKLFAARCATCHTVPDPGVRTDAAWLEQVDRTA